VFTARYGLIAYIKEIYSRGGMCLQRGMDCLLIKQIAFGLIKV
jgi:hypothetical protein